MTNSGIVTSGFGSPPLECIRIYLVGVGGCGRVCVCACVRVCVNGDLELR